MQSRFRRGGRREADRASQPVDVIDAVGALQLYKLHQDHILEAGKGRLAFVRYVEQLFQALNLLDREVGSNLAGWGPRA